MVRLAAVRGRRTCMQRADTAAYSIRRSTRERRRSCRRARPSTTAAARPPRETFPKNLRMIAGDSGDESAGRRMTYWNCGIEAGVPARATSRRAPTRAAPSCACTSGSPSAGTAGGSTAPTTRATWPTRCAGRARRRTRSRYPRSPRSSATRRPAARASPSPRAAHHLSAHADFLNAWNPGALKKLVNDCLNALVHCAKGSS